MVSAFKSYLWKLNLNNLVKNASFIQSDLGGKRIIKSESKRFESKIKRTTIRPK